MLCVQVLERDGCLKVCVTYKDKPRDYYPEEIAAMILMKLKHIADNHLQRSAQEVAISVPACFTFVQRKALMVAAQIAGLEKVRLVDEPIAVALACGLHKARSVSNVLVFDFGG